MRKLSALLLSICLIWALTACTSLPAATPLPSDESSPVASAAAETPVPTDAAEYDAPAETESAGGEETVITGPVLVNSHTAKLDLVESENRPDGSYRELLTGDGVLFLEFERALPNGSDAKTALEDAILQANPTLLSVDAMQDDTLTEKLS